MTAGPFMMTNLEGLFSPFRDLETEMDELRTMRRVSQIWREMERREQGAWMMFGRFFDREMDDMNRTTSSPWDSGLFSHPSISRINHSFDRSSPSNKEESNVIVEFPTDDREIKITLEEPLVVITEVEDTPDPSPRFNESPDSGTSRNSSPIIKSSVVINEVEPTVDLAPEPESSYNVAPVTKARVEHIIPIQKTDKIEKKPKKVDFSKVEVHFEPGSGRVNIVETNEKPPSNQLFRRKRRHRSLRSESPKLNFVGSSESESFENISPETNNYEDRLETPHFNSNVQFTRLQNDLDLSIFNLRNTLFKNSLNEYSTPTSKNVLASSDSDVIKEKMNVSTKKNNIPKDKILSDKNVTSNYKSYSRSSFNVSTKLQDMIQNSVNNQIKIVKTRVAEIKEINVDKSDKQTDNKSHKIIHTIRASNSPGNTLKGRNSSLKRSNSKGKELTDTINNYSNHRSSSKQSLNDDRIVNKSKPVTRSDSFKKNPKVTRQESIKSTSSRGSINNENRLCQKKNNLKDSFKRETSSSRINRTPSIGKITTNSLKKGGIYVDGRPKKTKGATVTVISFSSNAQTPKRSESPEKSNYNNITVNNYYNSRNKVVRKDSLRSQCSKESLISSTNKIAQNKKDEIKDSPPEKNIMKYKENSFDTVLTNDTRSNHSSSDYAHLNFDKRLTDSIIRSKNSIYRNIPIYKQDSFNSDSSNNRSERLPVPAPRTKKVVSDESDKKLNEESDNVGKDNKHFNHQDTSLFQPIKKERTIHSTKNQVNEIKTPVAIRKKSNYAESKRHSPVKGNSESGELPKRSVEKNKSDYIKFTKTPLSKLSLAALRRSKEPLRSFEKISNGWVGRCNMASGEMRSETKWGTRHVEEMKITSHLNNLGERSKGSTRDSASPASQSSFASRITEHQQKEAMIRLSRGYPSRKLESPSTSYLKQNMETRKRCRNVYTPSSISSQSSNIPVVSKRRPAQYVRSESVRSDTPVPSEPVYETLNSRRKTSTALVKRNRQTHSCCNI